MKKNKIIEINKDQLSKLEFKKVNKSKREHKKWELMQKLKAAQVKRKDGDGKVNITLKTSRGLFSVSAAILMIGNDFVVLRGNIYIPIKSVLNVGF
ncbi:hypothetical protein [Parvicella tangerina]|uniref:Uncharacterized protein n=1 Tax=Parvicella tangerina TaxID=2829795 RepID=A0A916JMJ3_9FLAO|nr:hypothetical protein [Parvicella tangerina]CAG5081772.1 hypothetical protein CRYO30217_01724 [Parvicella tangerina]